MRSVAFLIGGIFLFFSCTNEKTSDNKENDLKDVESKETVADSLPETEWNGEYMRIKDEDEPKITQKSQGSNFYSMGRVKLNIGDDLVDFSLFERKKNVLTFTNGSITAFIRSAFSEDINLKFKKNDIVLKHKRKYKADPSGEANNSFLMTIKAGERGKHKEYTLESGEAEIVHFSPRLGTLDVKVKGTFVMEDGSKKKGEGTLNMKFEEAVMTAM